ncbi:hypothetical protein BDZ89DRAFT_1118733 [Hymenopellis radicata]|nr:hypothetical protein BDZ89DRAFT_1118733 [Hymenopellis radicata]
MPALINKDDADWAIGSLIQTNVESGTYGVYTITALISLVLLTRSGLRNSRARSVLFIVTLVMFGISTAHVCLNSEYFIIQFPTLTSDSEEYNPPWLIARSARIALATMILRRTDYFLSDAVVVWRTWCIWYDNVFVRAYLALVLLATGATSIATGILTGKVDWRVTNMLGTFCLLVTNFSTTILCAYKVWHYRRFIKAAYGGRAKRTFVENVLLVLVESGSIYCLFWLFLMLGDYSLFGDVRFELEYFMPHFAGLYASAVIIIISLSKTSPQTFYTVVDHNLWQQFSKPDGLEEMQFAVPKTKPEATVDELATATAVASSRHTALNTVG